MRLVVIRAILLVLWVGVLMWWHRPPADEDYELWGR